MKKLLIATMVLLFAIGIAANSYAAEPQTKTTTVKANVGEIFDLSFGVPGVGPGEKARSSELITFKTVDGSATWYYNNDAILGGGLNQTDPTDGKSDVALVIKSNVHPYCLKIEKTSGDDLDGKIGYEVGGAFDCGAAMETPADGEVVYPSGFAGSTGTGTDGWGELSTTSTVYKSGSTIYATYGVVIPISYALVPTGLPAADSAYTTTITYTLTPTLT